MGALSEKWNAIEVFSNIIMHIICHSKDINIYNIDYRMEETLHVNCCMLTVLFH